MKNQIATFRCQISFSDRPSSEAFLAAHQTKTNDCEISILKIFAEINVKEYRRQSSVGIKN